MRIDPDLVPPKGNGLQEINLETHIPPPTETVEKPDTFAESVLHDIAVNSARHPCGRRWCFTTLLLSCVLRTVGCKAYDYARNFFALPCKQTLLSHFGDSMNAWGQCLVDLSQMSKICQLFRRKHRLEKDEYVNVGIGVDAMSMEPVLFHGMEKVHNHVFLFELLPLSSRHKSMSIHIMTRENGNAGADVLQRIRELKQILNDEKLVVRFVATDGDRGYDSLHVKMFNKWHNTYYTKGLDRVMEILPDVDNRIVGDLLHLLKNARSKLLKGNVSVFGDGSFAFSAKDLEHYLHLGAALTDYTSKGRMRDIYVLEIFRLDNVIVLLKRSQVAMALFLLPYAMWVTAVMNPGITCHMRREFLAFVINFFAEMMVVTGALDSQQVSVNKHESSKVQFGFSENHLRRALNTLVVQVHEIERAPDNLSMDRIGTHVLECRFGMVRLLCRHKHSWKMISKAFSRLVFLDDLAFILGHPITIDKRVNVGGTKLTNDCVAISIPQPDISPRRLLEAGFAVMLQKDHCRFEEELSLVDIAPDIVEFGVFLQQLVDTCAARDIKAVPQMWHGSSVSNSTILARLIAFCRKPTDAEMEDKDSCDVTDTERLSEMLHETQCPK